MAGRKAVAKDVAGLTPKQAAFVREYVKDFNGKQAAIRAGYSKKAAAEQASRLLTTAIIKEAVAVLQSKAAQKSDITVERLLTQLGRWTFGDIRKLYDEHGNLRPIHELGDAEAAMVAGMDVEELSRSDDAGGITVSRTKKLKRVDPLKGAEMLGRYFGIFRDDRAADPSVSVTVQVRVQQVDGEIQAILGRSRTAITAHRIADDSDDSD